MRNANNPQRKHVANNQQNFFRDASYQRIKMRKSKAVFLLRMPLSGQKQEEKRLLKLKFTTNYEKNTEKLFS